MTAVESKPITTFDAQLIDEFRANEGVVGGSFKGKSLVLLHHRGAKSGLERVTPLAYLQLDHGIAIFASNGGADRNPAWYYNLLANPETTVEIGAATMDVTSREVQGEERLAIWTRHVAASPAFGAYARKSRRDRIPVMVLTPR
jgi:deazaflavin-dependent oxidoreductase (nitroreductase family)